MLKFHVAALPADKEDISQHWLQESLYSYKRENKNKTEAYLFFIDQQDLGIWGFGHATVLNLCLYNVLLLS